jgi:hypothetical protein
MTAGLRRFREVALSALVIVEALWIFVLAPLEQTKIIPNFYNDAVTALIVAITLILCSGSRWAEIMVIGATILDVVVSLAHRVSPVNVSITLDLGSRIVFLAVVTVIVGYAVFGPGRVDQHRIQGAIAMELTFALMFAFVYRAIDGWSPGAFGMSTLHAMQSDSNTIFGRYVYFSFVTLTSTGYGDMVPLAPFARSTANLEALVGQLYPATLLARLVSLEIEARRSP